MEAISQEVYEAVKAKIKAEEAEKRKEQQRIAEGASKLFDPTKKKYIPKLIARLRRPSDGFVYNTEVIKRFREATNLALNLIGERNVKTAFLHDKAKEANEMASSILEEWLNEPPRGYLPSIKEVWDAQKLLEKKTEE